MSKPLSEPLRTILWVTTFSVISAVAAYLIGLRAGQHDARNAETKAALRAAETYVKQHSARPETVWIGKWLAEPVVRVDIEYGRKNPDGTEERTGGGFYVAANGDVEEDRPPNAVDAEATGAAVRAVQRYVRRLSVRPDTVRFGAWEAKPIVGVHMQYSGQTSDGIEESDAKDFYVRDGVVLLANPPFRD